MGSVRRRGQAIRVDLESAEIVVLASFVGQVRQLLIGVPGEEADPVLDRLLPDAYRDDPESAAEFRQLMDSELRQQKTAALQQVLDDLSGRGVTRGEGKRYELDDDDVLPWLYALTDVRLTLGTTLDVSEDMADEIAALDPDSPRLAGLALYDWLGWLQDSLVRATRA